MELSFLGNLGHRLRLARDLPPKLVLAKLAKRLPWVDRREVRVAEIVNSPAALRADRLIGFFREQEEFLRASHGWEPIDFSGRHVLEIGPGPLAGWGPMALFRGARSFVGVDPDWIDGVFEHVDVEKAYLKPHHQALTEAFGPRMDYPAFRARLASDLTMHRVGLDAFEPPAPVDIVLSNSCLEHIGDLAAGLANLARAGAEGVRSMHLVNFGNHRDRARPFSTIYEMAPEAYRRRFGRHINLMRPPDVSRAFADAGIEVSTHVVDRRKEDLEAMNIHDHWRERYSLSELAIRTALFVGSPPAVGEETA